MKIAVVGATGLVGGVMLKVLEERNFPVSELIPVATEKSVGKQITFKGKEYPVVRVGDALKMNPIIALFSAGGNTSLEYAPSFAKISCYVIDNSSAWRMNPKNKLIVPEINSHILDTEDTIIANPNCSTIQLVMTLAPLHRAFHIKRVIVSTYQSVTGTGIKAVRQLEDERNNIVGEKIYPYSIDKNCIPQCDVFTENGYTKEEMKLVNETQKILGDNSILVTATAVRVPVVGGHSESVNIEFEKDFEISQILKILENTPGVKVLDDISKNIYPFPQMAEGKNDVFVGRIRRDYSNPKSLNLWIVSDNLRKGAATNAVQIAEYITKTFNLK